MLLHLEILDNTQRWICSVTGHDMASRLQSFSKHHVCAFSVNIFIAFVLMSFYHYFKNLIVVLIWQLRHIFFPVEIADTTVSSILTVSSLTSFAYGTLFWFLDFQSTLIFPNLKVISIVLCSLFLFLSFSLRICSPALSNPLHLSVFITFLGVIDLKQK